MSRGRKAAVAIIAALAIDAACQVAHAQPSPTPSVEPSDAPEYTLEVDSDEPDVISFEALAARIGSDLGGAVSRPGALPASRVAIAVRFRGRELVVRAVHAGGRTLERTVKAEGDAAAIQREAVLLAGNLARNEAREILDALAARAPGPAPKAEPARPAPAPPPKAPPAPDEGELPVTAALLYPLATNFGRPNVASWFDLSLLYGRVGTANVQLGSGVVYASREVLGTQIGSLALAEKVNGAQISASANLVFADVTGASIAGAANVAQGAVRGAQISGGTNVARGSVIGAQITGGANIATHDLTGAQFGVVNVAESVDGVQAGVVNVARKVRGAQLGLINVVDEIDGTSLGLVSISRHGVHPIVWGSNLQYFNVGVKFSTKYVYTITAFHYGTPETEFGKLALGTTAALGGHIPLDALVAGLDLEVQSAITNMAPRPSEKPEEANTWVSSQIVPGYNIAPHLRVFAGGGARFPISVEVGRPVVRPEVLAGVQF